MADGGIGKVKDFLGGPPVFHQGNFSIIRVGFISVPKVGNIVIIRPAEGIDALVFIPHNSNTGIFFCNQIHNFIQGIIIVLVFVNKNMPKFIPDLLKNGYIVFQYFVTSEDHIAKIQGIMVHFSFLKK